MLSIETIILLIVFIKEKIVSTTLQINKQFNRDLTEINPSPNFPKQPSLKMQAFENAKFFILEELHTNGNSPEQIVQEILKIGFSNYMPIPNPHLKNAAELKSQLASIKQLACNDKSKTENPLLNLLSEVSAQTLPRGFQKLLGVAFFLKKGNNVALNGKFKFAEFQKWIKEINSEVAKNLNPKYFEDFKLAGEGACQVGEKEYANQIRLNEITGRKLTLNPEANTSIIHNFNMESLVKKLVKGQAGYESFVEGLTKELELSTPKDKIVIGDLDGDMVRMILTLILTGKVAQITQLGVESLHKLILLNQRFYADVGITREDLRDIQLKQRSLIPSLVKSITYKASAKQLIFIGDIFFDRLANFDGLTAIITDVHQNNRDSVKFIIGNHEMFGLGNLSTCNKADNGAFSYSYIDQAQYQNFLNDHFDFIYYDSETRTVYSHTMFDIGRYKSEELRYLDYELTLPLEKPEDVFKQLNIKLKDSYLRTENISKEQLEDLKGNFTEQGRPSKDRYLIRIAKINYLLKKLEIKSVFGHDNECFQTGNFIGVNRELEGYKDISETKIGYCVIKQNFKKEIQVVETTEAPVNLEELARESMSGLNRLCEINGELDKYSALNKILGNCYRLGIQQDGIAELKAKNEAEAKELEAEAKEELRQVVAKFNHIEVIYMTPHSGDITEKNHHGEYTQPQINLLLLDNEGNEQEISLDKKGLGAASFRDITAYISERSRLNIEAAMLAFKKAKDFEAALSLFYFRHHDKYELKLENNNLIIINKNYGFRKIIRINDAEITDKLPGIIDQLEYKLNEMLNKMKNAVR
jgi:hypothetical protein